MGRGAPHVSTSGEPAAEAAERRFPTRPFLAASSIVIRDGRALLAQRVAPPLVWSAPGGIVEVGESLEAAALRELREETGVIASIAGLAGCLEHIDWERGGSAPADSADRVLRHYVIMCFAASWISGEGVVSIEAPALQWVTPEQARHLPVTTGLHAVLTRALHMNTLLQTETSCAST